MGTKRTNKQTSTETNEANDQRGGKREGAGRPPSGRVKVEVSFDPEFLKTVDEMRENIPRGEFLEGQCGHIRRMQAMSNRFKGRFESID